MKMKQILIIVFMAVLLFPVFMFFQLEKNVSTAGMEAALEALNWFQISIWVSWAVFACIAVYFKWTRKSNFFFTLTYVFLFIGFVIFGFYTHDFIKSPATKTPFEPNYPYGFLTAVINLAVSAGLTGFLQIAVFWFTRRWHRR